MKELSGCGRTKKEFLAECKRTNYKDIELIFPLSKGVFKPSWVESNSRCEESLLTNILIYGLKSYRINKPQNEPLNYMCPHCGSLNKNHHDLGCELLQKNAAKKNSSQSLFEQSTQRTLDFFQMITSTDKLT